VFGVTWSVILFPPFVLVKCVVVRGQPLGDGCPRVYCGIMPKASVIVLSRDHPDWVARAIQWLARSFYSMQLEVIVVDDCSDEPLMPVLAQIHDERERFERVRMIRFQEPAGDATAYNVGLDIAAAPYVSFCDGHDLWLDGWGFAVDALDKGAGAVGTGACERMGDDNAMPGALKMRFHHANLCFPLYHMPYIGQGFMVRRDTAHSFRVVFSRPCELWSEPSTMAEVAWWIETCAESSVVWSGHNRVYRKLPEITWYATPRFQLAAAFIVSRPDLFAHSVVARSVAFFESSGIDVELVKRVVDRELPVPSYNALFDSKD